MKKISILLFLSPVLLFAQKQFTLEIKTTGQSEILNKISYKKSFTSKSEREKEIHKILFHLYDNAYLTACTDSSITDSLKETVYISIGEQYHWVSLRKGNADEGILNETGYRDRIFREKLFNYKEVSRFQEKIISYCENNGYPFAAVKLDSITLSGNKISASLHVQKNNLIKIDSVVNRGNAKIAPVYLQSYLGIHNGDLYNESIVKKTGVRVKELPFVKEKSPFRILFTEEGAKLELFLDKKRASQFDGIIGILPDNKTGKILFTGDVRLKLLNSFNRGELIDLNWKRLQAETQDLKSRFVFPFIFKSPFGLDANFRLYKKDSTYIEVNPNIGVQYHFSGGNYLKVFVNRREMNLISTKTIENNTTLPDYADITSTMYGISLKSERLDYRLNPRKGFSFIATAGAGNKAIHKNPKLNEIIYEGKKLKTVQYNVEFETEIFFPLKERSAFMIGNKSAYLYNETMFKNELFRIGGLKSLRGFDEESVSASLYSVITLEYRFLFEENSYLFLFGDGSYYENRSITFSGDRYDTPYGFGAGISFETKAGIFSINYALGKQFNNPILLKSGKVHFGIVNYF